MAVSQRPTTVPQPRRPVPDALERLYVYWLVSTALLVVTIVAVALMTGAMLHRQAAAINELSQRVRDVQASLEKIASERELAAAPEAPVRPADEAELPGAAQQIISQRPAVEPKPPAVAPSPDSLPDQPLSESAVQSRLSAVLADHPVSPVDVTDPAVACELVELALPARDQVNWSGSTWSRLAVLARLIGNDTAAEAFAQCAAALGDPLLDYAAVSARALLARGQPQDALPFIERLAAQTEWGAVARVLLAAALMAIDDPAGADQVLEGPLDPEELDVQDRVLLAGVLMGLEHWDRLARVLDAVDRVPSELAGEQAFLVAVSMARTGRTVEALAILDGLLADVASPQPPLVTPDVRSAGFPPTAWPLRSPDAYQLSVWRGVTLMLARQPEAARQVLQQAAELDPARAGAHYYLGVLEARAGRPLVAMAHLKNALAASARMAPAWETLAALEIEQGQVDLALQHLAAAIRINPRRASAHFLTAVAHAKLSQPEPAAEALRMAFRLEPSYLEEAEQTDVLLRLFTVEQLAALAAAPVPQQLPAEDRGATGEQISVEE